MVAAEIIFKRHLIAIGGKEGVASHLRGTQDPYSTVEELQELVKSQACIKASQQGDSGFQPATCGSEPDRMAEIREGSQGPCGEPVPGRPSKSLWKNGIKI